MSWTVSGKESHQGAPSASVAKSDAPARGIQILHNPRLEWMAPFSAAFALGIWRLGQPALWVDERSTWSAATRSTEQLISTFVNSDMVFAAYYIFMHYWVLVGGDSESWMRLPSVVAISCTAACTAILGRRIGSNGMVAGLIVAVLPISTRFAQEARVYAFTMLFVVLATLALHHAVNRRASYAWALYGLTVVLVGASHLVALSILAAHAGYVLIACRTALWAWLSTNLVALGVLGPLIFLAANQTSSVIQFQRDPNVADVAYVVFRFGAGPVFVALFVGVIGMGVIRQRRWDVDAFVLPLLWITLPVAVGMALTTWLPVVLFGRYFAFLTPAWALLAAYAVNGLPRRVAILAGVLALVLMAPAHWQLRQAHGHDSDDPRPTVAVINAHARPGDAIVYTSGSKHRTAMDYYLPPAQRPMDVLLSVAAAERASFEAEECKDASVCLSRTPRVWLLGTEGTSVESGRANVLANEFELVRSWRPPPGGVSLELWERRQSSVD